MATTKQCFVILIGLVLVTCLLLINWTSTESDRRSQVDYSILRRTQFRDILQRDKNESGTGYLESKGVNAKFFRKVNGVDDDDVTPYLSLEDILKQKTKDEDDYDVRMPKPVQKGSEQIELDKIVYKSSLDEVTNSKRFMSPLLQSDRYIRNCITGDAIGDVPGGVDRQILRAWDSDSVEISESRKASFQEVFDTRAWGHSWNSGPNTFNASGRGATLVWTQEMAATLHRVVLEIRSAHNLSKVRILDAPCGDMAWIGRFLQTRDDIEYTGVDIVPDLIQHHRQVYQDYPNVKFVEGDLVEMTFTETYDVIISRMALQHLFFVDVFKLLNKFSSISKYLLATTFSGVSTNEELDIHKDNMGRFRRLNLEIPPISLTPPLCLQRDGPRDTFEGWDHFIGLWKLPLYSHTNCSRSQSSVLHRTRQIIYSCIAWSDKIK